MDLDAYSGFLLTYRQWIAIGVIVAATLILTRSIRLVMNRYINRSAHFLKIDKTRYRFFSNFLIATVYVLAVISIIHTIPALRSVSTALFASAGILAAVIGFASQQAMSNIVSGVFVVVFRPFRVGDSIRVGTDMSGTVEDITLRHTVIRDAENARFIIPNSLINSQTVINYDIIDPRFKKKISFNIAIDNDLDKAMEILREKIFEQPELVRDHYPSASDIDIEVIAITERFVTIRTFVWAKNADHAGRMANRINKIIFDEYKRHGIHFNEPQTILVQQPK